MTPTFLQRIAPLLGLVACACSAGGTDPVVGAQPLRDVSVVNEVDGLRLTLSADRQSYGAGAKVQLTLAVENISAATIVLEFASGRQYDFEASSSGGQLVWNDSFDQNYIAALTSLTLESGQRWQRSAIWPGTANGGGAVRPGVYRLRGLLTPGKGPIYTGTLDIELAQP